MNIEYVRSGTEEEVGNQELEIRRYADSKKIAINKFTQVDISSRESQKDKNNNDLISRLLITLVASFGELERDLISKCIKEALKLKKESGVTIGRPKGTTGKSKLDGKEEEIQNFLKKDINKSTIAKLLNCDRNTLNNCIKSRNI